MEPPTLSTADASASSSPLPPPPYTLVDVEVDKPIKKPHQIEAVLSSAVAWADLAPLVFIGTNDNTLHCYVPSGGSASATSLNFLRWHTSYKKVFHACARFVDSWGVYMTIMDAKLTLLALPLLTNAHLDGNAATGANTTRHDAMVSVEDSKSAVLFAVNESARVVSCLTKQNQLKIYDWTANRTLELRVQHDLTAVVATTKLLSPSALPLLKMLVLGESHVLLLFKKEWCVVNADSGKIVELAAASRAAASSMINLDAISCATLLPSAPPPAPRLGNRSSDFTRTSTSSAVSRPRDAFVAGKHFAVRISIVPTPQPNGETALRVAVARVLEYNVPPKSAFFHHPFVLLDTQDKVAVYSAASMKLVEPSSGLSVKGMYSGGVTVALPSSFTAPSSSLSRELLNRGLPVSFVSISAPFCVQLLQMTPIPELLAQHIAAKRLEDAVVLTEQCPEEVALNDDERHALLTDYALLLFRDHQFSRAMEYFFRARVAVERVLALYPSDLMPRVSIGVVAQTKPQATGKAVAPLVEQLQGERLVESLLALTEFLTKSRDALAASDSISSHAWDPQQQQPPPHDNHKRMQLLDTVLLKCLVLLSEQPSTHKQRIKYQLFELVRASNWCEVSETEVFLRAHNQFDTLLGFYASRKLHRKALELLEDLERSAAAAATATTVSGSTKPGASSGLQSPSDYLERTALYLKRLGHKKAELVFEFSRRVLFADPVLGLSIFTHRESEMADGDTDLDPLLVVNHLKSCPVQPPPLPSSPQVGSESGEPRKEEDDAADPAKVQSEALPLTDSRFLAIEYITQVILHDRIRVATRLHDDAVYLLLDAIHVELQRSSTTTTTPAASSPRLAHRVSSQRGLLGQLRRKLLAFLESRRAQFHPERMLSRTPQEMVDERAALLSRLGRHHEVLQLYALQLRDAALAEAYCNKCYETKQADASIYSTLLRMYLRPTRSISTNSASVLSSSPPKPLWQRSVSLQLAPSSSLPSSSSTTSAGGSLTTTPSEAVTAAINILNKYAERIDVPTALDLLPSDVPIAMLADFFRRVIERQVARYRNGQIKMQLAKMENFKVRETLTVKRKQSVTVWSSHCCDVCGKKLGVGTFVRLPQAGGGALTLVHYACQPAAQYV